MQRHHHSFLILGIIFSLLNLNVCPAKTELARAKAAGLAQPNSRTVLKEGLRNKAALSSFPGRQPVRHHAEETEFESLPALVPAGITFTVNSTADPGTGGCDLTECTLREAITAANAAAGSDNISFSIPGGGVKTITPTSFLPAITSPVVLDGYTQPGASSNTLPDNDNAVLMIVIDLSAGGGGGISISAGSSTVRGLVINHGGNSAISMDTNGNNTIEGNFIGTNVAGATDTTLGTANGVLVQFGSSNNIIGGTTPVARNLISNNGAGVALFGGTGNLVEGNFIGTDRTGSADLGNGTGISVSASANNTIGGATGGARNVISGNATGISVGAANTIIQGNYIGVNATGGAFTGNGGLAVSVNSSGTVIGGTTPASRNVISGHSIGIGLNTAASTTVQGNFIGTDATGTAALGNSNIGLSIANACNNSLIGGTSPGAGNVISANGTGIFFNSGASTGVTVQGNMIGTDVNGTADLGNTTVGINVSTPEVGLVIGGSNSAARNVISGNNSIGLFLASSGSTVQGNLIGTAIDGSSPLGNGSFGMQVSGSNNQIGGTAAGTPNVIAFNGDTGVFVTSGTNNAVRGNSIHSNAALGIDLATIGITANDLCDADAAANLQQNFPALSSALNSGGVTTVQGTLNSTAGTAFTVEFFANPVCDSSGQGEGRTFLGSVVATTDGSCNASINLGLPVLVAAGQFITATATDPNGNTSEFSNCVLVTDPAPTPTPTPTVQFSASSYSVNEAGGSVSVTVTRSNTSGAATVDYRTTDTDTFTIGCAGNSGGAAYGRCDFATSNDTLSFAAGEASKSFLVPIINDVHVEGSETFQVVLSNPSAGFILGTPATATITITDNDSGGAPNPILAGDNAGIDFFVRQHYLDFLAREPEVGEPWSPILRACANQFNLDPTSPSAGCDRITVSGSFFGSPEFLSKGIYTIVFYRVAFIRLPEYTEFAPDLRSVTGTTAAETNAKRAAFANNFVLRPEFASLAAMTNTNYVNTLMGRYGLSSITTPDPANPDGGVKVTLTSTDLTNRLNALTLTRAQVLRAIVQSDQVSLNFEAVNAFVASQYYGYLRRKPDTTGFNSWVTHLSQHPDDFRTMVHGFVNSVEYRLRFGP